MRIPPPTEGRAGTPRQTSCGPGLLHLECLGMPHLTTPLAHNLKNTCTPPPCQNRTPHQLLQIPQFGSLAVYALWIAPLLAARSARLPNTPTPNHTKQKFTERDRGKRPTQNGRVWNGKGGRAGRTDRSVDPGVNLGQSHMWASRRRRIQARPPCNVAADCVAFEDWTIGSVQHWMLCHNPSLHPQVSAN